MIPWYLIFLKRSLVFPILLFSSISLHWSLRKAFLSLLAILWISAFRCLYLAISNWIIFGCAGSSLLYELSLVVESGGCTLVEVCGLLVVMASLVWSASSRACGASVVVVRGLQDTGSVALRNVESSQSRNWTCVLCIGRWILYHWTTMKITDHFFLMLNNIPLSEWSTLYLVTYWRTSWLLPGLGNYK